ncbi:hypothetical protein RJ640_021741 [Escallonia rubra]|uniref:BZIP domain-containing protein n=1 Tax=Escallonia rubra TaxID=112253 RepID=A0AA88QH80_9ASTE|nr:hypothetical protein RJ640_021741 [Escallonia rubra]
MASPVSQASLGSGNVDEKKRKRMISNRESARRSRMRKQQQVEDLAKEASQLEADNNLIMKTIEGAKAMYSSIASKNDVLRAQVKELTDRLNSLDSLNSVLSMPEDSLDSVLCMPQDSVNPFLSMPEDWLNSVLSMPTDSVNPVLSMPPDSVNPVLSLDTPEFGIPDIYMEPWQFPCPMQPIMASDNMFQR